MKSLPLLLLVLSQLLNCPLLAQTLYDPARLPKGHEYFELRDGLSNCHRKFSQEKSGRVVFLGGSITAGGGWRQHVCDALTKKFPTTKFEFINAGISSMGSVPHAFRLDRDVLSKGPIDLLLVEAAVNDSSNIPHDPDLMLRGMEGVVRHVRTESPLTDIVQLHFVMPPHMDDYKAGRVPISIAQHERVAVAYRNPSLHLAREVTDRIENGEFTWENDFKGLHPSPFGHQLYANSVSRLLDAAFVNSVPDRNRPNVLPAPLDAQSYFRGRLGDISMAKIKRGFKLEPAWAPNSDSVQPGGKKIGVREGFVNVPALVATQPDSEFEFAFEGTGCGLFIASGPDAGVIEFSVDAGDWRKHDTLTQWSSGLHLPWAIILEDQLSQGAHVARVRIAQPTDSSRSALRVFHLLLN